tara:strand:- start:47 stop:922 length:876 start_codon:yes stop_codon:yes gene_type:complete
MSLGSIVGRIIPAVTGFVTSGGNPLAAASSFVAADQAKDTAKKIRMQQAQEKEFINMELFGGGRASTFRDPYAGTLIPNQGVSNQGETGFFSTLRSGLRETGGFISDVFASGIPQLFGRTRPPGIGQQPAVTTVTNVGAQESQGSGSVQAGVGSVLPSLMSGARGLLKSPLGQLALGGGTGLALSGLGGQPSGMRITRKMKSQARTVLNMTGGNLSAAAEILGVDENTLVMILLKRFRNDGPVVTKAALRKTKQTVRRLKSMCDMYDSLRPSATRRRTPMKRASTTTLIKN